jgi:stress-induced morphogen
MSTADLWAAASALPYIIVLWLSNAFSADWLASSLLISKRKQRAHLANNSTLTLAHRSHIGRQLIRHRQKKAVLSKFMLSSARRSMATSSAAAAAATTIAAPVEAAINTLLNATFKPTHLEVINESHMHNVPVNSESHFKVFIVSEAFKTMKLIERHRSVNKVLAVSGNALQDRFAS